MLIDTHCHIHDADYPLDADEVIARAHDAGVDQIICIGTDVENSRLAIEFAGKHPEVYATVGIHPHYAAGGIGDLAKLLDGNAKIVAIGEIGLDYHYPDGPSPADQISLLKSQIELALAHNLPIAFHIREAYDDFWPVFDSYSGIRGVMHGFTDSAENATKALDRGLFIAINGISTFTKIPAQQQMYASLPLDRIILETDAPYLTPVPFRGSINEPAFVSSVADFGGKIRGISSDEMANATTSNAQTLFNL